jgi:hypothetical protein
MVSVGFAISVGEVGRSRAVEPADTLATELAAYTTAAERSELAAVLARYGDDETAEIRSILDAQAIDAPS